MKKMLMRDKLAILVIVAMLLTNPVTGQYVAIGMMMGFDWLLMQGAYVSLAGLAYLLGLGAFYYARSEEVKIPKKPVHKTQKYIET